MIIEFSHLSSVSQDSLDEPKKGLEEQQQINAEELEDLEEDVGDEECEEFEKAEELDSKDSILLPTSDPSKPREKISRNHFASVFILFYFIIFPLNFLLLGSGILQRALFPKEHFIQMTLNITDIILGFTLLFQKTFLMRDRYKKAFYLALYLFIQILFKTYFAVKIQTKRVAFLKFFKIRGLLDDQSVNILSLAFLSFLFKSAVASVMLIGFASPEQSELGNIFRPFRQATKTTATL